MNQTPNKLLPACYPLLAGGNQLIRISADNPTGIQDVPIDVRGLLDSCHQCPSPRRFDLYAPEDQYVRRGELNGYYLCVNGHRWLRKFGAASTQPITRTPGLIGYLEHHDRGRPNMVGVWCTHCCLWHVHPVADMVPDRVAHFTAQCYLRTSPYRRTGYQVWTGETLLAVARDVRPDANADERRAIRWGRITPQIERMRRSRMGALVTDINQDAVGWDCNPFPPIGGEADSKRCALYWHFDADDVLLYIGITEGLSTRGKAHALGSAWVYFAVRAEAQWYPNRAEAMAAEVAAIKAERPLFNVQYNDTPEARARLVAYLVEHGRMDLLAPAVSRG